MDVKKINSTLVTLVHFDQIPFFKLLHGSNLQKIQKLYQFKNVEVKPNQRNQPTILFQLGLYKNKTEELNVHRIEIEERKIVIEIDGHSSDAIAIYSQIRELMRGISAEYDDEFLQPIVQSKESLIIAKLDFHANILVHPKLLSFVNTKVIESAVIEYGQPRPKIHSIAFRIDYLSSEETLKDYRITLSPKEFSLSPRDGTSLDEQIFISKAPINTDAHLGLLEEVEDIYR
jgi:hypothetical protein